MQDPLVVAFVAASAALLAAAAADFGTHFKVCSRSDPQLGQCIVDSLNGAREQLVEGIPELNMPPLDPLWVENMLIEEGQEDVNLKLRLSNLTWLGMKDFTATSARVDFAKPYLEIETQVPACKFQGRYDFGGRVLTLPINGKGDFDNLLSKLNVTHRLDLREEQRGGRTYWKVTRYRFDMELESVKLLFRDLFRGNRRLGNFANDFLNRNWRAAYAVYRPFVIEALGGPFKNIANALFDKIPVDELFSA